MEVNATSSQTNVCVCVCVWVHVCVWFVRSVLQFT